MDYKLRLKAGIFLTAIITALLLSNIVPPFILAVVFFLTGITLSYFAAIDVVKERKIKEMAILIKACESISCHTQKQEILALLEVWVKRLVTCKEYYLWRQEEFLPEEWATLLNTYRNIKEPVFIKDQSALPSGVSVMLLIPLVVNNQQEACLILANDDSQKIRDSYIKFLQPLITICSSIIASNEIRDSKQEFDKSLFLILLKAQEGYSPEMIGHAQRVAETAILIGKRLGLDEEELMQLEYGSLLHDIGQLEELFQGLKLDSAGEERIKTSHPVLGAKLLPDDNRYVNIKDAILYHHEHYNGTGYPKGLKHTDIPLIARIIAVADAFDALTRLAAEEDKVDHKKALLFIKKASGTRFDPLVVAAFEEVLDQDTR